MQQALSKVAKLMTGGTRWMFALGIVLALVFGYFISKKPGKETINNDYQSIQYEDDIAQTGRGPTPSFVNRNGSEDSVEEPEDRRAQQDVGLARVIEFIDGEEIEVVFRSVDSSAQYQASAAAKGDVRKLRELALEGNGYAAYEVYKLARECVNVPETFESLEDSITKMFQTFTVPHPSGEGEAVQLGSEADIFATEKRMRDQYVRCQPMHEIGGLEPSEYLRIAADAGTRSATLEFASQLLNDNSGEAAALYFEKAWNNGDVNGAWALGEIYLEGYGDEPPDRLKAYAYTYVGTQLAISLYDGLTGGPIDSKRKALKERSDEMLAKFFPSEAEAATPLAKEILRANSRCCVY